MLTAMFRRARASVPPSVWLLSWTSFFTDTASEAIYPLLPVFLSRTIGASALSLGVIEGVAEAANSLLKVLAGRASDRWRIRKPLVLAGYGLSTVVRPLVGIASSWTQVFAIRISDRLGKGIRGAPRDAMLASWAEPSTRGYIFGLNRAMDHAGAVCGPLLATAYLWWRPGDYRTLFVLTLIPGLAAMLMLRRVREPAPTPADPAVAGGVRAAEPAAVPGASGRAGLGRDFRRYLVILVIFALGNSTDAFLLLRLSEAGVAATWIPLLWAALHVVKAAASPLGGALADRFDRRRVIVAGWIVYAVTYLVFARVTSLPALVATFLSYGLYYALTEGGEKALVADVAPAGSRGLAFGWYHAAVGIGSLAASLVFGLVWTRWGTPAAFHMGAALAAVAAALLWRYRLPVEPSPR